MLLEKCLLFSTTINKAKSANSFEFTHVVMFFLNVVEMVDTWIPDKWTCRTGSYVFFTCDGRCTRGMPRSATLNALVRVKKKTVSFKTHVLTNRIVFSFILESAPRGTETTSRSSGVEFGRFRFNIFSE